MKNLILTLAIVACSALAFGQQYSGVKITELKPVDTARIRLMSSKPPVDALIYNPVEAGTKRIMSAFQSNSIVFKGIGDEPVLIFKANGDIIYKGQKLDNDTAIVNGLRKVLAGERRVK